MLTVASFAYAVNFNNGSTATSTVSQYMIASDGSLTPLGAPTVPAGVNPFALAVDASNQYLYVANFYQPGTNTPGSLSQFALNSDGSLAPLGVPTVATLHGPSSVVANPKGPYVYVADFESSAISQYAIGAGGALAPMSVASFQVGTGNSYPVSIAVNPAGTNAYVATYTSPGSVYQYSVAADGSLSPLTSPSVPAGSDSNSLVVDPSGHFVYVANAGDNTVSQYSVAADGSLAAQSPATVAAGKRPWSITVDAAGHNAYVANRGDGTVWQYLIGAGGALTYNSSVTAGTGASFVAFDPSGHTAYVTNRDSTANSISEFSVAADGTLSPLGTASAAANPSAIVTR
jgi:6-phosphogluconolactonase (cycloisomerase 2 family)